MTLETELRDLLLDVRPSAEQEQRFLATAARKASQQQRRRRTLRLVVVPLVALGCVAAVAVGIASVNWGGHTPPVDHPDVVTVAPTPPPTASATPRITPLPPLSYQPYPGVNAKRAAEIVTACTNRGGPGEPPVDPGRGTLEDLVDNGAGDGVLIEAPVRAGTTPQVGLGPTRAHTALLFCRLNFKRPEGRSVDVPLDVVSGHMRYEDHAIPGPLLVDGSYVAHATVARPDQFPVLFIYGRVARNVYGVIADGPPGESLLPAEIRNGYFLMNGVPLSGDLSQINLRAYDKAGHLLAITKLNSPPDGTPATVYWP